MQWLNKWITNSYYQRIVLRQFQRDSGRQLGSSPHYTVLRTGKLSQNRLRRLHDTESQHHNQYVVTTIIIIITSNSNNTCRRFSSDKSVIKWYHIEKWKTHFFERSLLYVSWLTCSCLRIFYHAYGVLIYETHYGLLICLFIRLSVPCHFLTSYFYRLT